MQCLLMFCEIQGYMNMVEYFTFFMNKSDF